MTGPYSMLSKMDKMRIEALTGQELGTAIIAERLNLNRNQVYTYQVRAGLRIPKKRGGKMRNEAYFYYIMDKQKVKPKGKEEKIVKKPVVTVCLIKSYGISKGEDRERLRCITRGVAICSDSEMPVKKEGRNIARGKAMQALYHKKSGNPVTREEARVVLTRMGIISQGLEYGISGGLLLCEGKSTYEPVLTVFEEKLLAVIRNDKSGKERYERKASEAD